MLNPSIKRLLGAVLLIATVGASSILATRTSAANLYIIDSHHHVTVIHRG